jgi:hypothetical protein
MLIKKIWQWIKWGTLTEHITAYAGSNIPAEIEYHDRFGRTVGFYAYGDWHPNLPYKGD